MREAIEPGDEGLCPHIADALRPQRDDGHAGKIGVCYRAGEQVNGDASDLRGDIEFPKTGWIEWHEAIFDAYVEIEAAA